MARCYREYKIVPDFKELIVSKKMQHFTKRQYEMLLDMTIMLRVIL